MSRTNVEKKFKELTQKDKDMVVTLAMGITASRDSNSPVNYNAKDVCDMFELKRSSYAAVQANITRRK